MLVQLFVNRHSTKGLPACQATGAEWLLCWCASRPGPAGQNGTCRHWSSFWIRSLLNLRFLPSVRSFNVLSNRMVDATCCRSFASTRFHRPRVDQVRLNCNLTPFAALVAFSSKRRRIKIELAQPWKGAGCSCICAFGINRG